MELALRLLSLGLAALFSCGCVAIDQAHLTGDRSKGCTFVLSGIQGPSTAELTVAAGLAAGGDGEAIVVHDWTTGAAPLFPVHLCSLERNQAEAETLAARITEYQDEHPDRPVRLVGHSGGAGLIVLALERLPAERTVESAVLLAPALSPEYDLTPALRRSRRGIWNYHSALDFAFLGGGTLTLGTIDREHTIAAGAVGFAQPADPESRRLYAERLHQVAYQPEMLLSGNLGGHFGPTSYWFVRDWIARELAVPPPERGVRWRREASPQSH
jgi:pimeloyl-ACP methyl ester carboxylesterase